MPKVQGMNQPNEPVTVREVGLRDGLQILARTVPTEHKLQWLRAAHAAGLREIEVGSFVPARLLPQLADTALLVEAARQLPGLVTSVLVPNLKGAQAALDARVHSMLLPLSASHAHSLANLRKTPDEVVAEIARIRALRDASGARCSLEVGISTAFGCTLQGRVDEDEVLRLAAQLAAAGVDEVGLSDTTGMANPAQVRRLFTRLRSEIGDVAGAAHLHNTRGLGLANCLAAWDVGVTTFDASLGGLGGCPYAPGASGNVVTEDLVFMFEAMGVHTGVDLPRLIAAREPLRQGLPGEPIYGMTPEAGLPKGFLNV
jgi:hydroxymethylglutaryl-CoA lyase